MKLLRTVLPLPCLLLTAASLTPVLPAADQMPQDPVTAYTFDEGTGATVADPFGNITGTLVDVATFSTEVPLAYAGNFSLDLSAAGNDYVDLGDQASLFFPGAFSISVWVRPTEAATNAFGHYVVADYIANADQSSFAIRLNGTSNPDNAGKIGFFWEFPPQNFPGFVLSTTDLDAVINTWYHITAVSDGAETSRLYINGILENEVTFSQTRGDVPGNIAIGRAGSFEAPNFNFEGQIDEVAFFNYALNGDEASWLFHNSIRGLSAPPAAPFDIVSFSYNEAANTASLTWTSAPGDSYIVDRSPDLQSNSWTELLPSVPSGGATTSFTDTTIPASARRLFYRVRRAP
jgi:hypothetical protein